MLVSQNTGEIAIGGHRTFEVRRGGGSEKPKDLPLRDIVKHALPFTKSVEVNKYRIRNFWNVWRGLWRILVARLCGIGHSYGALYAEVRRGDGTIVNLGLLSLRVVTTAGVNKIVACLNTSDASTATTFKYHGFGTGTTAEASGDTALVTELTTEYATNSTRPTGSQTTGGSSNIYRTVGTLTPDSGGTLAITEHGVFSASSSGTLLDRSKFSAVNLDSTAGDSLQVTYDATFPAGS